MSEGVTIRELFVALGIKADEKALVRFGRGITMVKSGMASLVKLAAISTVAVGAFAAGLIKATLDTTEYASAHSDAAKKVGVTAEEHQELAHAAQMAGVSTETLDAALIRQAKAAYEAGEGSKTAAAAFSALGVRVLDENGKIKSQARLLEEIADGLGKVEKGKRIGLITEIFGRGGAALIPLLEGGAEGIKKLRIEARKLGLVMAEDDVAVAEAFGDQLDALKGTMTGLRNTIGLAFIPVFSDLLTRFRAWWMLNQKMVQGRISAWAERLAVAVDRLFKMVRRADPVVTRVFGGWLGLLVALGKAAGGLGALFAASKVALVVAGLIQIGLGVASFVGGMGTLGVVLLAVVTGLAQLALGFGLIAFWIGVVVLGVQDLVVALRGGDSYFRDFLESIGRWEPLAETVKEITDALTASWESLTRTWKNLRPALDPILQALRPLADDLEWLLGVMSKGVGQAFVDRLLMPLEALAAILDRIATGLGRVEQASGAIGLSMPSGDQAGNAASGVVQTGRAELGKQIVDRRTANQSLNLSASIVINGAGDPIATGDAVRAALRDEVRAARAASAGGSR